MTPRPNPDSDSVVANFSAFAGDDAFGHLDVRDDLFRRFAAAGKPARDSRGEQVQRLATVQRGRTAGEEL